jgi:hypothetical protein
VTYRSRRTSRLTAPPLGGRLCRCRIGVSPDTPEVRANARIAESSRWTTSAELNPRAQADRRSSNRRHSPIVLQYWHVIAHRGHREPEFLGDLALAGRVAFAAPELCRGAPIASQPTRATGWVRFQPPPPDKFSGAAASGHPISAAMPGRRPGRPVTRVSALSAAQGPGPGFHGRDTRPGSATMVPGTGKRRSHRRTHSGAASWRPVPSKSPGLPGGDEKENA